MLDVVPEEGGDHVVRMIVQRLHPQTAGVARLGSSSCEVLRLQLVLEEAVLGPLVDQDAGLGPRVVLHQLGGVVGLPGLHGPEVPQGTVEGLTMGAKAETEVYMPGFLRWATMAPCPPMLWPVILLRSGSTGNRPCSQGERIRIILTGAEFYIPLGFCMAQGRPIIGTFWAMTLMT